jgi:hypothetical protein
MKKYYKVVRMIGRSKQSAMCNDIWRISPTHSLKVIYHLNKWSCPPAFAMDQGYGLTCFENLRDARKFIEAWQRPSLPKMVLYECEINNLMKLQRMWGIDVIGYTVSECWPTGTVMTDKIKLVRRVK